MSLSGTARVNNELTKANVRIKRLEDDISHAFTIMHRLMATLRDVNVPGLPSDSFDDLLIEMEEREWVLKDGS